MTRSKPVYDAGVIVAMLVATGAVLGAALFETAGYGAIATAIGAVYARPRSAPSGVGTTEPTGLPPSRPIVTVSPALLRLSDNNGAWTGADAVARFRHQQSTGQVDAAKVNDVRALCAYDTKLHTRMNPNLIIVNGALIGTTEHGTFSIDPANCHENWRVTENYKSSSLLAVSRGTARHDSLLFRGTEDNRLLAYNLRTGKRVWEAKTAEARVGESAPAGPIAWDGLIFSGNAGAGDDGEDEGMYALDAKTGKIVWEFYLLPPVDDESPVSLRGATRVARPTPEQSWDRPVTRGATWTVDRLALRTGMVAAPRASAAPAVATDPGALRLQLLRLALMANRFRGATRLGARRRRSGLGVAALSASGCGRSA